MSGLPDQQIHPVATGNAAKIVAEHQDPQELVFHSGWFCPFVQRTWIALEERGIPYQYKEVNPYKKEPHFLAINPKGLVPAIEYRGKALYESLVLIDFLEDASPAAGGSLYPPDPYDKAYARIWIDHISKAVVPGYMRLLQAQDPAAQASAREEFYKALRTISEKVKGPYFFGEQFSVVDVALAPWVMRWYVLAENRGVSFDAVSPEWKAWAEALAKRESVVKTQSDKQHYAEIYGRYLRDEAQSEAAKAIRAGRVIP